MTGAGESWPSGRVGYVAILGRPNTGKSTLLNQLLQAHLAPVSEKPQTTRRRLLGVYSAAGMQILFLDTPGLHDADSLLDAAMRGAIRRALADADVILCMADPTRAFGREDAGVAEAAGQRGRPVVVLLNKSDLASAAQQAAAAEEWKRALPQACILAGSALRPASLGPLLAALGERLPEGPFLYPADTLTDAFERQLGVDLIREAVLEILRDEVPHATAVEIEEWGEKGEQRQIRAVLHVERSAQKPIVLGAGGSRIREIRIAAQAKLAEMCGVPVRLQLWVKVSPDWRRNPTKLREFGYL
jgi:GTP-binding protein Era